MAPTPKEYVVKVFGETTSGQPYHGTGFLLNSRCDVVTCWHVVRDAAAIFIKLPSSTEEWICDRLVHQEIEDLAVLRPKAGPWIKTPYALLHPDWFEEDRVGDAVGLWGYSNPLATICAFRLEYRVSGVTSKFGLIMLDRTVDKGDSGGPLINDEDHVVGLINYRDKDLRNHSMATPISRVCKLLTEKAKNGGPKIEFHLRTGGGQFIGRAIDCLRERLIDREVRKAMEGYSDVFRESSNQISILHAYKKMHDLLHEVEFGCYQSIVIDSQGFPEQQSACEKISIHLFRLRKHVSDAEDILAEARERGERIAQVRDQLSSAYEALDAAEHELDAGRCRQAINMLRVLLSFAPSHFNRLLNEAARNLKIVELVEALQGVQGAIGNAEPLADTVDEFRLGIDDLATLGRDLETRTKEHDNWQLIDDVLRGVIDSNNSDLLTQLESFLPLIRSSLRSVISVETETAVLESVAAGGVAGWRTRTTQEAAGLEDALAAGDVTRARRHFRALYQHASERLDRVDKKLLQICGRISNMKNPLGNLVEKLQ